MNLRNRRELAVTKEKLRRLEEWYAKRAQEPAEDEHVRQLSLQSLQSMIDQLREEITQFEAGGLSKNPQDQEQLKITRKKLRQLEALYEKVNSSATDNPRARELTLHSIKKLMNQLTEEIVHYESRVDLQAKAP